MKRSHLGVPMIVFKSELKLVFAVKDPVNCLPQKVKDQKVQQYALTWRIRMILMCSVHLTHAFVWVCLHVWEREKEGTSEFEKEKIFSVCVCVFACVSQGEFRICQLIFVSFIDQCIQWKTSLMFCLFAAWVALRVCARTDDSKQINGLWNSALHWDTMWTMLSELIRFWNAEYIQFLVLVIVIYKHICFCFFLV